MHFNCAKQQDNLNTNKNKVSYSYVLPPLAEVKHRIFYFKEVLNMRIPYGFNLTTSGALEINEATAKVIKRIFDSYMTGASLGKIVEMLSAKQILSPTGKSKWTRATIDHILSNSKYIVIVGMEMYMDVQFEKAVRCNIDYDEVYTPRKSSRYVSLSVIQKSF